MTKKRKISVLGATGSIGRSTLDLIAQKPEEFEVIALTANDNVEELVRLAKKFSPQMIAIANSNKVTKLEKALEDIDIEIVAGCEGVERAAKCVSDICVAAIVGIAGLRPTLHAIENSKLLALANKESIVCAGKLIQDKVAQAGCKIIPIDSEHNAIFQVWENGRAIDKVILTASGGPFKEWDKAAIENATPAQAIAHPNWTMGAKISVDSATMMNKGLELIEAAHLFDLAPCEIDIVVHPQSIVHSLVAFHDGSVLAQLGAPDMRIPISYALSYPTRLNYDAPQLNLTEINRLEFFEPDLEKFPALKLARMAAESGCASCIALNAANEIAVKFFLEGRIKFKSITMLVEDMLEKYNNFDMPESLDQILELDKIVREDCMASI